MQCRQIADTVSGTWLSEDHCAASFIPEGYTVIELTTRSMLVTAVLFVMLYLLSVMISLVTEDTILRLTLNLLDWSFYTSLYMMRGTFWCCAITLPPQSFHVSLTHIYGIPHGNDQYNKIWYSDCWQFSAGGFDWVNRFFSSQLWHLYAKAG